MSPAVKYEERSIARGRDSAGGAPRLADHPAIAVRLGSMSPRLVIAAGSLTQNPGRLVRRSAVRPTIFDGIYDIAVEDLVLTPSRVEGLECLNRSIEITVIDAVTRDETANLSLIADEV